MTDLLEYFKFDLKLHNMSMVRGSMSLLIILPIPRVWGSTFGAKQLLWLKFAIVAKFGVHVLRHLTSSLLNVIRQIGT